MLKTRIVFTGRNTCSYTSTQTKKRVIFYKNEPKYVSFEDAKYLLSLREKGCRCHNQEGRMIFVTYDEWKEYRG